GLFRRGRMWLVPGVSADFVARQQRVVEAVTATGADLHKHYRPGIWLPHCSLTPRATLAQLPLVVKAVMDVLPLRARLDRAALVNSATGDISPLAELPCPPRTFRTARKIAEISSGTERSALGETGCATAPFIWWKRST